MLPILSNAFALKLIGGAAIAVGLFVYGYKTGYDARDSLAIASELKTKNEVIETQNQQIVIQDRIVYEYVDRVKAVDKISVQVIETIKELPNEINNQCIVGDAVIGLYNQSNGYTKGTSGVDGATGTPN